MKKEITTIKSCKKRRNDLEKIKRRYNFKSLDEVIEKLIKLEKQFKPELKEYEE